MKAVIERGVGSKSIRLLQEAFNMRSMSLYASLGFDVVEPIVMMTGRPQARLSGAVEVRQMNEQDLDFSLSGRHAFTAGAWPRRCAPLNRSR